MFTFDGTLTPTATATQAVLANCGLPVSHPEEDDSFALVVYRKDPLDQYYYITGYAGLRHPEPMFGPSNYSDFRATLREEPGQINPYGFRRREQTTWVEATDRDRWQLHVNGRARADRQAYLKIKDRLVSDLGAILNGGHSRKVPLYPDLWYRELLARDRLRDRFQTLQPGAPLEDVAQHLCQGVDDVLLHLVAESAAVHVGLYLDTGGSWTLCSGNAMTPWLPKEIPSTREQKDRDASSSEPPREAREGDIINLFDWVSRSTRSLRLNGRLSAQWGASVRACGGDLVRAVNDPQFSGMAIVPVLYPSDPWRCMGILLVTVLKASLLPAHIYLLNRLAIGMAGYLMPLMPVAGFPWWPDARLSRGGASLTWEDNGKPARDSSESHNTSLVSVEVMERAIRDLMPTGATVRASSLRSGHSGTEVVRLTVVDAGRNPEVPRILKIGEPATVADELRRYYRYVHNKRIGAASRVDVARSFWVPDSVETDAWKPRGTDVGAIVYTLVGAGDPAQPWSYWATRTTEEEFTDGLALLQEQLTDWSLRTRPRLVSAVELLIGPLASGSLADYTKGSAQNPSISDVVAVLKEVVSSSAAKRFPPSKSCIVHGDLHADNVFAVISPKGTLHGVALIDWGQVTSKYHPLSDISKLAVDLEFRVQVSPSISRIANDAVRSWGIALGCGEDDWKLAMINQLARLLFYKSGQWRSAALPPKALLPDSQRVKAWAQLQAYAQEL